MSKSKAAATQTAEVAKIEVYGRIETRNRIVDWTGKVALAIAIAWGIGQAAPLVEDLAGRDTNVNFVGQLGWGTGLVNGLGWYTSSKRRRQLENATTQKSA